MESIEKLRKLCQECWDELLTISPFTILQMLEAIEAEIVDADGETIHVGDTVYSDFHDEWRDGVTVYEIAFTDGDGTRVYTADGKWVKVNRCSHVKPRTIEDALEDFAHNYNSIGGKPDEDELWVKLLADTSAELREMLEVWWIR